MLKDLWQQQTLIVIGYGFSDTWLDRNLDDVLARNPEYEHSRHIALIGIKKKDEKHVTRYREMMQNLYRVNILFYRIDVSSNGNDDHSKLRTVLENAGNSLAREKEGIGSEDEEVQIAEEYLKATLTEKGLERMTTEKDALSHSLSIINRNFREFGERAADDTQDANRGLCRHLQDQGATLES